MLTVMQRKDTTLEHVFYMLDCLAKCEPLLHKSFVDSFFDRMRKAVEDKVMLASEQQLRQIKKERVDELVTVLFDKLMVRQVS